MYVEMFLFILLQSVDCYI